MEDISKLKNYIEDLSIIINLMKNLTNQTRDKFMKVHL